MYPRLIQKYGKEYARQALVNPRVNVSERSHAIVGSCTTRTREGYTKGWERCMQHRLKPERHMDGSSFGYSGENLNKLNKLKSISKSVAKALSSIREPQLCDNYEVGTAIGMGREGIVRPCWLIADTKKQASSKILNSGHAVVDVGDLGPVDKKSESYLDVTVAGAILRASFYVTLSICIYSRGIIVISRCDTKIFLISQLCFV